MRINTLPINNELLVQPALIKAMPIVKVRGVSKSFPDLQALDNINLDMYPGEVLAILGANGAGKTTLINVLLGRLATDAGQIEIFSEAPGSIKVKRQTGTMLQVANLPETLKIIEHIKLFQSYYPEPMDIQKVLDYSGLAEMQNRYTRKLSGGEKQRLLFALSICGNPKLLFLDEPSAGMDMHARRRIWQAIRALKAAGTSIVLTTHYLEEADSLADKIVLLNKGQIVKQGTSAEIKANVGHTIIRFVSPIDQQMLSTLPGVLQVQTRGKYLLVHSSDSVASLHAIFDRSRDIKDLSVSPAALEDAIDKLDANALPNQGIVPVSVGDN
jgi:ABC-2 type transport system ATP-binding protein